MWPLQFLAFGYFPTIIVVCSGSKFSQRITGGETTDIRKYPYQVMILCRRGPSADLCGGALIQRDVIVTAAHCVVSCDIEALSVTAGVNEYDGIHIHRVYDIIVHPNYEDGYVSNDIAIVILKQKLRLSNRIRIIPITDQQYPSGTAAVVTGWGLTGNDAISRTIRVAKVNVLSYEDCRKQNSLMDNTQICTDSGKSGPCKGDSGGPLVADGKLIGLVSYGKEGCDESFVRMYCNVHHFRKFILSNI